VHSSGVGQNVGGMGYMNNGGKISAIDKLMMADKNKHVRLRKNFKKSG
jgi:hypothetical protein